MLKSLQLLSSRKWSSTATNRQRQFIILWILAWSIIIFKKKHFQSQSSILSYSSLTDDLWVSSTDSVCGCFLWRDVTNLWPVSSWLGSAVNLLDCILPWVRVLSGHQHRLETAHKPFRESKTNTEHQYTGPTSHLLLTSALRSQVWVHLFTRGIRMCPECVSCDQRISLPFLKEKWSVVYKKVLRRLWH